MPNFKLNIKSILTPRPIEIKRNVKQNHTFKPKLNHYVNYKHCRVHIHKTLIEKVSWRQVLRDILWAYSQVLNNYQVSVG